MARLSQTPGDVHVESTEEERMRAAGSSAYDSESSVRDHCLVNRDSELEDEMMHEHHSSGHSSAAAADRNEDGDCAAVAAREFVGREGHAQQQSAAAAESDQPADATSLATIAGARPLLQEHDLQQASYHFLRWLGDPPLTQCEALCKARRVKSDSQLNPIKSNLRFIYALLYDAQVCDRIDLEALTQLPVCRALHDALVQRQIGSGRMHAIMLLVEKVIVYLSGLESIKTRQFVQPTFYSSYLWVDGICADSGNQRKQEARDRMVLGNQAARRPFAAAASSFQVPTTWRPAATAAAAQLGRDPQVCQPRIHVGEAPSIDNANAMTTQELKQVAQGCLEYLSHAINQSSDAAPPAAAASGNSDRDFAHHVITATLALGLAPRSQILRQMCIGSSLVKENDDRYWICILSQESKNGRATRFALPTQLTPAYDTYLRVVRPRLLAAGATSARGAQRDAPDHDFVYCKRDGSAPRADFSSSTCVVTMRILGKAINAHAFRSAVITTFYSSGATTAQMHILASIMAHDPETARQFYYKPMHSQAAVETGQRVLEQLLS